MTKTRKLGLVALATGGLLLGGAGAASADTLPGVPGSSSIVDALTGGLPVQDVVDSVPGLDAVDLPVEAPAVPGTEGATG